VFKVEVRIDIIKAHGGEIKVKTLPAGEVRNESKGTEFIIGLPMKDL
jgi:signal transduction histidine kinase